MIDWIGILAVIIIKSRETIKTKSNTNQYKFNNLNYFTFESESELVELIHIRIIDNI